MNKFTKLLLAASFFAISGTASAVPITGNIDLGGGSSANYDGGSTIAGIDFSPNYTLTNVSGATPSGSFAPLASSSSLTINFTDFLFADVPSVTVWTVVDNDTSLTYSFSLENITEYNNMTDPKAFGIKGTGLLNITGGASSFEETSGRFTFTQSNFSFSSGTIPEPSIIALLGLGLLGMGVVSRRRMKS